MSETLAFRRRVFAENKRRSWAAAPSRRGRSPHKKIPLKIEGAGGVDMPSGVIFYYIGNCFLI